MSFSDWRRLLPASIFFSSLKALQQFLFPMILAFFGGSSQWFGGYAGTEFFAVMIAIPIVIGVLQYISFRYRIVDGELQIKHGILHKVHRKIPLQRIQNIRLYQGLIHRFLGVVDLQVETAGAQGKAEAELSVVSIEMAHALRQNLIQHKVKEPSETVGGLLHHLGNSELIKLGIIHNRGLIVVGIGVGFFAQLGENFFDEKLMSWFAGFTPALSDSILSMSILTVVLMSLAGLSLFLMLVWALSIALSFTRYYDFSLSRETQDLRLRYGLLAKIDGQVPLKRIQSVTIHSSPAHRWFGRLSVKVRTAADNAMQNKQHVKMNWLLPLASPKQAFSVLSEILPEINWNPGRWNKLHANTPLRLMIVRVILSAIIVVPAVIFFGKIGWLSLLILFPIAQASWGYYKKSGWVLGPDGVHFHEGWVFRDHSQVPYSKIQSVKLLRGPVDRLFSMASISVDAAGNQPFSHDLTLHYLPEHEAHELLAKIVKKASESSFTW